MFMKTHHIMLFTCYTTFLVGTIAGAALAHSPLMWLVLIILTFIAVGLMGYFATKKPSKKKLPRRRNVRIVR
jgi:FtsH-binding integral membrane protein